jgi:hypothetical protein
MMPGLSNIMGKIKPPPKVVTFTSSTQNINLRAVYNAAGYPAPVAEDTILFIVNPGVYIGATSTGVWALQPGGWPEMDTGPVAVRPTLNMIVYGRIQGHGGQGGGAQGAAGSDGGPAFFLDRYMNLVTAGAQIFAGGGGGGSTYMPSNGYYFNGGGGCGYNPGPAGVPNFYTGNSFWHAGQPGTTEAGGVGFRADNNAAINQGNGGGPGAAGQAAYGNNPGYVVDYGGGGTNYAVYGWGYCRFGYWDSVKQEHVYTGVHGADIRGNIV